MIYFKLFIGDYQRDTAALTLAEHGAYLLMLQHYYATEKPLPVGRDLYRLLRADTKQEREAVDSVAGKFWTKTEGGFVHQRADQEIAKAERKTETNRENGRLGGRPKKPKENPLGFDSVSQTEATEKLCHSHSHITPSLRSGVGRGSRLPPNWLPEESEWAEIGGTPWERELEKFCDYWAAQPGQKGVKADWNATWRNWKRKAAEYAESGRTGERLSAVERTKRDSEAWARRQGGDGVLAANGELVRPQVDERLRVIAGRSVDISPDDVGF